MSSDAECTTMTATVEKVKKNVSPVRATPTSDDKSATAVVATPGIDATASVSPALAASKEVSLLTVQTETGNQQPGLASYDFRPPCRYYFQFNRCLRGQWCPFSHGNPEAEQFSRFIPGYDHCNPIGLFPFSPFVPSPSSSQGKGAAAPMVPQYFYPIQVMPSSYCQPYQCYWIPAATSYCPQPVVSMAAVSASPTVPQQSRETDDGKTPVADGEAAEEKDGGRDNDGQGEQQASVAPVLVRPEEIGQAPSDGDEAEGQLTDGSNAPIVFLHRGVTWVPKEFAFRSKACSFWFHKGRCMKGDRCNFSHALLPGMTLPPPPPPRAPKSPTGDQSPRRKTLVPVSELWRTKPCKFWFGGGNCLKGDACNFSHDAKILAQDQPGTGGN